MRGNMQFTGLKRLSGDTPTEYRRPSKKTRIDDGGDTCNFLPSEIFAIIISHLETPRDRFRCGIAINKYWHHYTKELLIKQHPPTQFGLQQWAALFNEDTNEKEISQAEKLLPPTLLSVLYRPCPWSANKYIFETHVLVYIPTKIGSMDFSIENVCAMFAKHQKAPLDPACSRPWRVDAACWVLMLKDIPPASRNCTSEQTQELMDQKSRNFQQRYTFPVLIEVISLIIALFLETGKQLLPPTSPSEHSLIFPDDRYPIACRYSRCKLRSSDKPTGRVGDSIPGLKFSTGARFSIEFMDDSVKTSDCLGVIPVLRFETNARETETISLTAP
jgi:hypothetical protein